MQCNLLEVGESTEEIRGSSITRVSVQRTAVELVLNRRESHEKNVFLLGGEESSEDTIVSTLRKNETRINENSSISDR